MTDMHPGNLKMAMRAARKAQEFVHLIEEQGMDEERARRKLGISPTSSRRYRARWGTWSADLRPHWGWMR